MGDPASVRGPAILTIIAAVSLILAYILSPVLVAITDSVLPASASAGAATGIAIALARSVGSSLLFLAGAALFSASRRRSALVVVLVVAPILPIIGNLFVMVILTAALLGDHGGDASVVQVLGLLDTVARILVVSLAILVAITVWSRGPASPTTAPRSPSTLCALIVIVAVLGVLAQGWGLLARAVPILDVPDVEDPVSVVFSVIASTAIPQLPSIICSAALLLLLTVLVARASPEGRRSAWIAAGAAAASPVAVLLAGFAASTLAVSSGPPDGLSAQQVVAIPVHVAFTAVIIIATLASRRGRPTGRG